MPTTGTPSYDKEPPVMVMLPDGTEALLRPVGPSDRNRALEAFELLSPESRYRRFFAPMPTLGERMLTRLTDVDHEDHVAWCMLNHEDKSEPGLGAASFWRCKDDPTKAEISFTVLDGFQRRGVGTLLLATLAIQAKRRGIETFLAFSLGTNASFVNWFRAIGAEIQFANGQFEISWQLSKLDAPESFPTTLAAERLLNWHLWLIDRL